MRRDEQRHTDADVIVCICLHTPARNVFGRFRRGLGVVTRILKSLISQSGLWNYQVDTLIILFKLEGATFGAYTGSSVVDCCFQLPNGRLLKFNDRYSCNPAGGGLIQVRVQRTALPG